MFKFGNKKSVEVEKPKTTIEELSLIIDRMVLAHEFEIKGLGLKYTDKIESLQQDLADARAKKAWEIEIAKNSVRKELEKDTILSDLARVDAVARLEVFQQFDNKDDRVQLQQNFNVLLKSVGKLLENKESPVININNKES